MGPGAGRPKTNRWQFLPKKKKPENLVVNADLEVLASNRFAPIYMIPGDSINCSYRDEHGETILVSHTVDETLRITEANIVRTVFEGKRAVGGFFIER